MAFVSVVNRSHFPWRRMSVTIRINFRDSHENSVNPEGMPVLLHPAFNQSGELLHGLQ
jgi:hypothetical protein